MPRWMRNRPQPGAGRPACLHWPSDSQPRERVSGRACMAGDWNAWVMEPDSLLVRGLVDNPSAGLSPALDRSTTFDREPGGASPYGRGHAPVPIEAEALLG